MFSAIFKRISPIIRQLTGAGVGALIALGLYAGYQVLPVKLMAFATKADTKADITSARHEEKLNEIALEARRILRTHTASLSD